MIDQDFIAKLQSLVWSYTAVHLFIGKCGFADIALFTVNTLLWINGYRSYPDGSWVIWVVLCLFCVSLVHLAMALYKYLDRRSGKLVIMI